jgi:hypothetical protein
MALLFAQVTWQLSVRAKEKWRRVAVPIGLLSRESGSRNVGHRLISVPAAIMSVLASPSER